MSRDSLSDLIARVRVMVGDPSDGTQEFTSDDLERYLDMRRTDVVEARLRPHPSSSGSTVIYLDWRSSHGDWEDSVVLKGSTYAVIDPDDYTEDLSTGRWTFDASNLGPIFISGSYFDLYGSAAEVMLNRAAKAAEEFAFSTDQQTFNRSEKTSAFRDQAREYMRLAKPPGIRPAFGAIDW